MILLTATESSYEKIFALDFGLLADATLTLIAVFALFAVASYFLFNPARKLLNDRKEKIKSELDNAAVSMADAEKLKASYEEKLANIDKEAEAILSDARKRALEAERQIVDEAKEEAVRIKKAAETEGILMKQKIADDVKKEMIEVACAVAEKMVSAKMDADTQAKLLEDTLKEIGDTTWQN